MKLDLLLAQQGVPTVAPYGQADAGQLSQGSRAIAQAGQQLEGLAVQGLTVIRQAEEARKELAIRTDVARMKSRFQLDAHELDANLRTTVQDPDEYYQQLQDGLQQRYQQIADIGAKYPETMARLGPQLEQIIASQRMSGLTHRIALTKSSTNASIDETVRNLRQLARQTPLDDHATWTGLGNEIQSAIARGEPVNGANATGDAQDKEMASFFTERAAAMMRKDPEKFQTESAELFGGILGAGKLVELDAHAGRIIEARARDEDRKRAEIERVTERQVKKAQGATAIEARTRYDDGTLTDEWLRDAGEGGWLTPEKFEHYSELLRKPARELPVDPRLAADLVPEVYSGSRNIFQLDATWSKISGLIRSGQLPGKGEPQTWLAHLESRRSRMEDRAESDADKASSKLERAQDKLQTRGERDQDKAEARQRAGLNAAHNQVEQLAKTVLADRSLMEALSDEARNSYGDFLRMLSRRSGAEGMQGKENPYDIWDQEGPKFIARISKVAATRTQALLRETGGYQSAAVLKANRGRMDAKDYYDRMGALKELDSLRKEMLFLDETAKKLGGVK